jgi:hypothetical protein
MEVWHKLEPGRELHPQNVRSRFSRVAVGNGGLGTGPDSRRFPYYLIRRNGETLGGTLGVSTGSRNTQNSAETSNQLDPLTSFPPCALAPSPVGGRAAKKRDELAPPYVGQGASSRFAPGAPPMSTPGDGPSGRFGANSAYHGGDGRSLGKPELL